MRYRGRSARLALAFALLTGGLVIGLSVQPAAAASPTVDLWAPGTTNLTQEDGDQANVVNHIFVYAQVRHDPGTNVDGVRFDLVHAASGGTYSGTNCSTTQTVTCSGGYKTTGGWTVGNGAALTVTYRELPGQATATTNTNSNTTGVWVEIKPRNVNSWQNDGPDGGNNGICGIESGGPRICKNTASFSFHTSDGQTTADQTMTYWTVAENDGSGEDAPAIYNNQTTTNQATVTAGAAGAVSFGWQCDDNDGGGGNDCDSAFVRFRRAGDNKSVAPGTSSDTVGISTTTTGARGAVLDCALAASGPGCESRTNNSNHLVGIFNADDNTARQYTFRAPRTRGLYFIEAEFCNDDGFCPHGTVPTGFDETTTLNGNPGTQWQLLGSFYVNEAAPTVSFGTTTQTGGSTVAQHPTTNALHPNTGTTLTYNLNTSSDTQVVDWNLDQNNTNGINSSGYETRKYGTMSYASSAGTPTLASDATQQTLAVSGTGGVSCAAAVRTYDTGAVNASDASVLSATASRTCTTNNVPTGSAQSGIQTARGASTTINLAASDADKWTNAIFSGAGGDEAPTISITQPAEGSVTCGTFTASSASAGTFPCSYSPGANASPGLFSFSYTVTDSHAGTSPSQTVTGSIKPLITGAASPAANANGWNNSNVTVTWTCTSSALSTCTSPATLSTEAANQSTSGTAVDTIGNTATATVSGISIDKTAPTISANITSTPNGAGWFEGDVDVSFTCGDALSGIAPGACPTGTITGEGTALSTTGTVLDRAGNSKSVTTSTVKIDRTAPATSVSAIPTWSRSSVAVTLTPSDNLSGVATTNYRVDGGSTVAGTVANISGDGVHTLEYSSVDVAGNVESTNTATVRIDGTAPTIGASVSPAPNASGWNNTDTTVTFTCSDGTSGVASCTAPQSVTTDGAGQVVSGTAVDNATNTSSTSATVNLDETAPTVSAGRPAANSAGWYDTDVTVTYTCSDATSGVASCPSAATVTTEGAGQSRSGTATDAADNSASASSTGIDIDKTDPTITASADQAANSHGYRVAPVTVTFDCTDALSGIASGACPDPVVVTASGTQVISGTVLDRAGNSKSTSISLDIAGAAPTISGDRSPAANADGWNNENVTVSFTCGSDALESCTAPTPVTADGANQSVTGTVTDAYGQSATATVSGISIDRVAPFLSGVATTAPNGAGWYHAPVTMHWTCTDALSGIAAGACPADAATSGEGSAVSTSASVVDKATNSTNAVSEAVQIDLTAPSTTVSSAPTWSKEDVTLTLNPVDGLSGVASTSYSVDGGPTQSGVHPVVSGQGSHSVSFWSTDVAGNVETAQSTTVDIDTDAPSITAHASPAPNGNGWNNETVTVSFTCSDTGGSGIDSCSIDQVYPDETDTTATGTAADVAGNTASTSIAVRIDLTAPTITAQQPAPNANGWFNAPVQVSYACVDTGGSGIGDNCPSPQVYAGEGANQAVSADGSDNAGNHATGTGTPLNIDLTDPVISGAATNTPNGAGGYYGAVTVHWTCSDALSGIAPAACPADQTVTGEGVHTVSGAVNDRAGNTSSADVTVRIDHNPAEDPAIVKGTVTDVTSGAPLAGAVVSLTVGDGVVSARTTSGTDGRYLFPAVADGTYGLAFSKAGTHLPAWYSNQFTYQASTKITVAHGSVVTADEALTRGHVITGVITGPNGPVSGATVKVSNATGQFNTNTDASGRYRAEGMAPGTWSVTVASFGNSPGGPQSVVLPVMAYGVQSVITHDRTLTAAAAGYGLKGTVTAASGGQPLAGAIVRIWPVDSTNFGLTATTGANGRFTLASLPNGTYQIDVVRADYKVRWYDGSASRSTAQTITVSSSCTPVVDSSWGDPCARMINLAMSK